MNKLLTEGDDYVKKWKTKNRGMALKNCYAISDSFPLSRRTQV
jgi:hypothetical protein